MQETQLEFVTFDPHDVPAVPDNHLGSSPMRAYVVNLVSAAGRRRRMETLLNGLGIHYHMVEAVVGKALTADELRQFHHHDEMSLCGAEYGCLLSHVKCWSLFLESGDDAALILEDDVHFSENFLDCVASLRVPASDLCVIRLETFFATVTAVRQPAQRENSYSVFKTLSPHGGTAAYVINRPTAAFLVGQYRNMRLAIDIELFFPDRCNIPPLAIYQVIPAPCIQDHMIGNPSGDAFLASGMAGEHQDEWIGLIGPDRRGIGPAIKKALRPLYRAAFSSILAFSGRRRIKVGYG